MPGLSAETIKQGHDYRGVRGANRIVLWIGERWFGGKDRGYAKAVQYDSDNVAIGRKQPFARLEAFAKWAREDVTR